MTWRKILNKSSATNQENKEYQEYQTVHQSNIPDFPYILGNQQSEKEIKDAAQYLFFERLGISDNEELALDEAFNHIIKQLTKH
jgi:hypothetical protein